MQLGIRHDHTQFLSLITERNILWNVNPMSGRFIKLLEAEIDVQMRRERRPL